jgi:hypothetical protein
MLLKLARGKLWRRGDGHPGRVGLSNSVGGGML